MKSMSSSGELLTQLLTPNEVSDYLCVPTTTLANWRYLGQGPPFAHVGRHVRYRADDLDAWVRSNVADPSAQPRLAEG